MQTETTHRQLMQLIDNELNLPSPPAIAVRILNAVQQDEAPLAALGEIIATDPALAAKMLKIANSGFFAGCGQITNINRAISVLGTNTIKNIALSFVIAGELGVQEGCAFNIDAFWRRSVITAVAAELLSQRLNEAQDDLFVTALLQNIGILVIARAKGDRYLQMLNEVQAEGRLLSELEQQSYGFSHQQVAYALLTGWNLPQSMTEPILYHHDGTTIPESCRETAALLCCAEQISEICSSTGNAEKARLFQQHLIYHHGFTAEQALQLLDDTAGRSREMLSAFELDPADIRPYSVLLQEANQELSRLNLSSEQMILEMREAREKSERLARQLQDANTRLKELVYRDGLTGLYNHRYFQESLSNELARATRYHASVSLILFDIDHFKQVNDTHGHPAGDLVLMNIARAVNSAVRPSDIVARYGGEEFAVILPETNAAGVKVFAARLRRCVEGIATLVDGQLIYVTVSAGATTFSIDQHGPGLTKDMLIDCADRGLYHSKQNGRNQVTTVDAGTVSG